jgi:Cu2+-exporting ATPase
MVKSGDALERLAAIDMVLTDKTGTLTFGRPVLTEGQDNPLFPLAASLATKSNHPLSRALASAYDSEIFPVTDVKEYPGHGLGGIYDGKSVRLGSSKWCDAKEIPQIQGSVLWFRVEGEEPVPFLMEDKMREDAADTVSYFKKERMPVALLSGDRKEVVTNIANQAGIENRYAEMTPPDKYDFLENIQQQGRKALMIGDGLNDAPTLAGAYVSMAPGTAIDLAQNAADIVFMGGKFQSVVTAHRIARACNALVKQNFAITVLYNLIAVPLAICGFVTPFVAALAMSGSSLIVIGNSFRLKWSS